MTGLPERIDEYLTPDSDVRIAHRQPALSVDETHGVRRKLKGPEAVS